MDHVRRPRFNFSQTQQEYDHRVMQDTRIQYRLWQEQERFLQQLYYGNKKATYMDFVNYLMTKAKHLRIAQDNPVDLDVQKAQEYSKEWSEKVEAKLGEIASVMPKVPVYVMKNPPKRDLFKLNGTLSVSGEKWVKLLALHEIDNLGYSESFKVLKEMKDGNARTSIQSLFFVQFTIRFCCYIDILTLFNKFLCSFCCVIS